VVSPRLTEPGDNMWRHTRWLRDNADTIAALATALGLCVLNFLGGASPSTVSNGLLAVLALLAVALIRDRWEREHASPRVEQVLTRTERLLGAAEQALRGTSALDVLTSDQITDELAEAQRDTDRWSFSGFTGTYLREVTLPRCVDNARRNGRRLDVTIEIIDPNNLALCARYVRSWSRYSPTPDTSGEEWTVARVQRECYATILAAFWHKERYDLIDIRVGLSSVLNTYRLDLSSSAVIVTQDDIRAFGYVIRRPSVLYDFYLNQMRQTLDQAREVPLHFARNIVLGPRPSVAVVRNLFAALGLRFDHLSDPDVEGIMRKAGIHVLAPSA